MLGEHGMAGLIVPSNNSVVIPEMYRLLPEGVTAYETRMSVSGDLTFEAVQRMVASAKAAGDLLAETGVDVIGYCCMASSVIKGWDWEDALLAQIEPKAPKGATSANRALVAALSHLGARRVALVTPYPAELNALLPDFLGARGITVRSVSGIEVRAVKDVRRIAPERIAAIARAVDRSGIDAVCLLATDLETLAAIPAVERALGLPVVSNNQAMAWEFLRRLGLREARPGYGRLLDGTNY